MTFAAVFYVVVLIGVLVFVHEFGHYLAAKLLRVKVVSFSIGFGPRLFGFQRWDTDWVVRLLPLGGYVLMLGADPMDDVQPEDKEHSFGNKPLWQRAIVILAGPAANLLLPVPILFFVMMGAYTSDLPPVVGQVLGGRPAQGLLQVGDEVVSINGDDVRYWSQLVQTVRDSPGEALDVTVLRDGEEVRLSITPEATTLRDAMDIFSPTVGRIGIAPSQYAPVIGITELDGPAAKAGLQTFDEVVSVNGKPVRSYAELARMLRGAGSAAIELIVLRDEPVPIDYGYLAVQKPMRFTLQADLRDGKPQFGLRPAEMFVAQVDPGTPASAAGLQRGDEILALDGKPYDFYSSLTEDMKKHWEDEHTLSIRRGSQSFDVVIQLEKVTVIGEYQEERPIVLLGVYNQPRRVLPDRRDVPFGDRLTHASTNSIRMTVQASTMLVVALYRMAEGRVSTKSIGGPIMIGHMASKAGEEGAERYLEMLAMISINLGIINLLPIPVLDGGHLMLFTMEAIKRGPLSLRTRQVASFIGLAIVVFLMIFAFKNDIERYWQVLFG